MGNELIKLCSIVPAGIVVFFVSYDYLDKVVDHFKKTNNNYIINKISEKKQVIMIVILKHRFKINIYLFQFRCFLSHVCHKIVRKFLVITQNL